VQNHTDVTQNRRGRTFKCVPVGIVFAESVFADEVDAVHLVEDFNKRNIAVTLSGGADCGVAEAAHLLLGQEDKAAFVCGR